ncbi:hypothetical protein [Cognatiyoonia sp. IB215182]|uniref:hypothetical protein n=1 Tax=Cognatiyoonia sp. IB215182 TaxID=3097353 RepID=UPI002A1137D6|nr:hypothetical protein [Cognatiyoonia sp. IB215182]MDX8351875.1 hypothetical protein [Cognatiyoonia sp. IB215182]
MVKPDRLDRPIWKELPFLIGIVLTIFVFGVFTLAMLEGEVCGWVPPCTSKWETLVQSPPNEIGDTLAGFAGSLAFVWLIVTVWLQATELREQRAEFEKMADAQTKQAELLEAQGKIFRDEQIQREQTQLSDVIDAKLTAMVRACDRLSAMKPMGFLHEEDDFSGFVDEAGNLLENRLPLTIPMFYGPELSDYPRTPKSLDEQVYSHSMSVIGTLPKLKFRETHKRCVRKVRSAGVVEVVHLADDILERSEKLSEAQRVRLDALLVREMKLGLERMLEMDLWNDKDATS